jgi:hypothetical protein
MSVVVIHPGTRLGFANRALSQAKEMKPADARRHLRETLGKYRAWAESLGVEQRRIVIDVAFLEGVFFPATPIRRRA